MAPPVQSENIHLNHIYIIQLGSEICKYKFAAQKIWPLCVQVELKSCKLLGKVLWNNLSIYIGRDGSA